MTEPPPDERRRWLDDPRHVTWLVRTLTAVCGGLVVADLFYHKHAYFGFEAIPGFHAAFGFIGCVALVMIAKQLRRVLMRDEDYYD